MCGAELQGLPEGVQRVVAALQAQGHGHMPRMLDDAARTAQQAADALGVALGQIAKSIIFRRKADDVAVLVITSGDRRVDEKKVEAHVGKIGRADAGFVKERTGFSIGGVAPIAHATKPVTLIGRAPAWRVSVAPGRPAALDRGPRGGCGARGGGGMSATEAIAARAQLLSAAGYFDANSDEVIPSPCISVCRMTEDRSRCEGCFRTIPEIRAWALADSAERLAIWARLAQRAGMPFPPEAVAKDPT